jgi:hypothetical protein
MGGCNLNLTPMEINWNTDANRMDFLRALRDVIRGTSADVHE